MSTAKQSNRSRDRNRRSGKRVSEGFTLIEMMLAMTITVMVMVGVLSLFQVSVRVARNQTQLADLQQNLRVALYDTQRYARMAGRGGLPTFIPPNAPYTGQLLPNGAALTIGNNVAAGTRIGGATTPPILPGTDTLTVRGVLFGSVYQSQVSVPQFGGNTLTVGRLSAMGVEQDLGVLAEAVTNANGGDPEALIVVSPLGTSLYGIVELTGGTIAQTVIDGENEIQGVTLNFVRTAGTRQATYYQQLMPNGVFPPQMTSAAYVGVLEEYRYYLRDTTDTTDPNRTLVPRLSRARFYPGSNDIHPSNPSAAEDIADNVWDLQIALGVDSNGDGIVNDGANATDEWLFNHKDDALDQAAPPWVWNGSPLKLMRITALVRTDQRDMKYVAPPITSIEDRIYNEPDTPADKAQLSDRRYRRRQVQSVIDFRNL
ncbi:MAG: hypothetical protein GY769_11935 [bacterium]|nr:hypothetical protein [bacterium]